MMNRFDIVRKSSYLDMVASHIRSQIVTLSNMLEVIERTHSYKEDYIVNSIKTVESQLRRLRKLIDN